MNCATGHGVSDMEYDARDFVSVKFMLGTPAA